MLDADLARVFGTSTRALNQALKRNLDRFPQDFAFRLNPAEAGAMQASESTGQFENRSQTVTGSLKHRDRRSLPWVFTEHGVLMAANVLRSARAAQMSVYVIRAFVRLRERVAANQAILKRLAEIDGTLLRHDAALRDIYLKLLPLLQPAPEPPKRRIGFHGPGD